MYLCGPGDVEIVPPPGTEVIQLEQAPSGHLVMPISEYVAYDKFVRGKSKAEPLPQELALLEQSTASSSGDVRPSGSSSSAGAAAPPDAAQLREPLATGRSDEAGGHRDTDTDHVGRAGAAGRHFDK